MTFLILTVESGHCERLTELNSPIEVVRHGAGGDEQLLAICRSEKWFSHLSLSTSLIFGMDNLLLVIPISWFFPEIKNFV